MLDFTSFTEVDTPGRLVVIAARSTFMGLRGNDADVYLYKALNSDPIPTNFSQEFEFYIDAADPTEGDRSVALVSYLQDLDDWEANRAANKNQVSVMVDNVAAGPAPRIAIVETNAGNVYTSVATYDPAMDTIFYCTFVKVGTVTTLHVYSDAARTTLVATLTLTLQASWGITYVMAPQSNGSGDADEISGYIQDMDDPISYEELYGTAEIRTTGSAEAYAKVLIQQPSEELYAHAIIRQSTSVEVYGHAEIRQETSVELYAHAIIKNIGSDELYAHAIIVNIGSAELYCHVVIQDTAELYGSGIIRNIGSAEEYGHGVIVNIDSAEIYCEVRISTDAWIIQGVSVEAYITKTIVI